MEAFPSEVHKQLNWYVYRLIDPRSGHTFYIGKGRGDRVFEHARGALKENAQDQNDGMDLKNGVIRAINLAGLKVVHVIHRHGLESPVAYQVEAALIDAYPGLTNVAGGHGSADFGCRSVEEIASAYAAKPLVAKEKLILIFVGKTLEEGLPLYEAVRGIWRMARSKAEQYKLVLAYDGVQVKGAYRPTRWLEGTRANFPYIKMEDTKRIGFVGKEADDVWAEYYDKRVPPRPKGAQSPIRYLPVENDNGADDL